MKVFFNDHNFVTKEVANGFEQVDNLLEAEALVTWTDITKTERDQIFLAKELGIPSIVIQHGRRAIVDYLPDYEDINSDNTKQKIHADYFCCWGKSDYNDLLKAGYTKDQIKWTGSPLIPNFPDDRNPQLITFLSHHDLRQDALIYNHEIHETLLDKYGETKIDVNGKKIPIYSMIISTQYDNEKLEEYVCRYKDKIVYESDINEQELEKKDLTDLSYAKVRINSAHQKAWYNMASILLNTKAVISVMPSSFEGLAIAMDIPVVRVKCDWGVRTKDGDIDFEVSEAVESVDIKELIEAIENINPEQRKASRKKITASDMVCEGSAVENIREVINGCKVNNPS